MYISKTSIPNPKISYKLFNKYNCKLELLFNLLCLLLNHLNLINKRILIHKVDFKVIQKSDIIMQNNNNKCMEKWIVIQ